MTPIYLSHQATTVPFTSREASAAGRLRSNGILGNWPNGSLSDYGFFAEEGGGGETVT